MLTPRVRSTPETAFAFPPRWSVRELPDLSGRTALVTGASTGLGLVVATGLAAAGARVLMACRDVAKGEHEAERLRTALPHAQAEVVALDLADLSRVRACVSVVSERTPVIDILVNNAGVMALPHRLTADGFEMQFGTNHLGHFALTGYLLPLLANAAQARVVTVSSTLHSLGEIDFDDLHGTRRYRRYAAYGQAKLANLLHAQEFHRRASAAGLRLSSVAAHPGYANTGLQLAGLSFAPLRWATAAGNWVFAASPARGAESLLAAATVPDLPGGSFVGPGRLGGYRGRPALVRAAPAAYDPRLAARMWVASEKETGVRYQFESSRR